MNNKSIQLFVLWLIIFLATATLTLVLKASSLGENIWVMVPAIFLTILFGFNLPKGFVKVPNQPPHFGVVTRLGVRLWKKDPNAGKVIRGKGRVPKNEKTVVIVEEGWNWIPFRGIFFGIIFIDMSKRSIDLPPQVLTTPDSATTEVPVSIAYAACKKHIINLLNLGTGDPFLTLEGQIADIVATQLRIWARNPDPNSGTPQTWKQLLSASGDAAKLLIEAICSSAVDDETIKGIQAGHAQWEIEHFGIMLYRLNLKEMKPFGEVYEASLKIDDETQQRVAETYEIETDIAIAAKIKEKFAEANVEISLEEALERYMKWKIAREANTTMSISAIAKQIFQQTKGGVTS